MTDETADQIQKLESHMAELERQVEQLNEVVVEQSRSLDKLKSQLRRITDTIENQELDRIKSTNPKPPHYQ
ncbi:MAG: SlyX family protein [Verrucomicrobia bacterium]|nr:SlyX family protein [Verrucomicrobiota bacterium]